MKRSDTPISYISQKEVNFWYRTQPFDAPNHDTHGKPHKADADMGGGAFLLSLLEATLGITCAVLAT